MKIKLYFTFTVFILSFTAHSQLYNSGLKEAYPKFYQCVKVIGKDGYGIPEYKVLNIRTNQTEFTDRDGYCYMDIERGDIMVYSKHGYQTIKEPCHLSVIVSHKTIKGRTEDLKPNLSFKNDYNVHLFFLDGIEILKDSLLKLNPDDIESMSSQSLLHNIRKPVMLITSKVKYNHELIVLDPGFESFLTLQKSKDFYSRSFLKAKNIVYVNEWNSNLHGDRIGYDAKMDYGIDIEYKLYMYFKYIQSLNTNKMYSGQNTSILTSQYCVL